MAGALGFILIEFDWQYSDVAFKYQNQKPQSLLRTVFGNRVCPSCDIFAIYQRYDDNVLVGGRVEFLVHFFEMLIGDVGINLSSRDIGVAK